jgi:hypothetical protein
MDNPKGETQVGLAPQTLPRVRAEAGHVVVRLELASLRDPLDVFDLELVLRPGIAGPLGLDLLDAAKKLV